MSNPTSNASQMPSTVQTKVVLVTPAMAAAWLENNKNNRTISQRVVDIYAAAQSAGLWRLTHQGIAFASNGKLLDGQHRLRAILKSGVSVWMQVTTGLEEGIFQSIDRGLPRTHGQILRIARGEGYGTQEASFLRFYTALDRGLTLCAPLVPPEEIVTNSYFYEEELKWFRKNSPRGQSCTGAALAYVWPIEKDKVTELARRLKTGSDLRDHGPEWHLHRYLHANRGHTGTKALEENVFRTLNTARFFIEDKVMRQLKASEESLHWVRARRRQLGLEGAA